MKRHLLFVALATIFVANVFAQSPAKPESAPAAPTVAEEHVMALYCNHYEGNWYNRKGLLWGDYGFYDGYNATAKWYPRRYLAIDQLTVAPMIENYRTGLLWRLFMSCPEIQQGLQVLDITYTPEN
ncbi:MAG: hypothetical protein J6T76_03545 [Paludibacteraceae bacterium]|nr:hypothetical protein [Paludibacteraceae bacterium]